MIDDTIDDMIDMIDMIDNMNLACTILNVQLQNSISRSVINRSQKSWSQNLN